jgi:protein-tyrosine sulfotransferase
MSILGVWTSASPMTSTRLRRFARYLPVLLRGRPLHGPERYRPFFIVGSGRCGSTLLRAMLEAHPDLHIPPESALGPMVWDYRRYSRLPWNVVLRILLARLEYDHRWAAWELALKPLFRELDALPLEARNLAAVLAALYRAHTSRHKPSAVRWGDKTPPNTSKLGALYSVFPDLQVVHLLRDGRDVVQSFLQFSEASLSFWADAWLHAVRNARAFGARHPAQYLEVRYEDLVREPRATLQSAATFLNVALDERMLHHHDLDLRLGDVDRYPSLQGVRQPVYRTSVGRWRTTLDAIQIAQLERLLGPTLATLGYHADAAAP